ncbi:hypothetical protein AB0M43_38345 [Longispora sp. NPDC051575]|uniref:hypothetical protein n=1 Tax=Longispora sp. NPDC051575 TaxID=3154943 RepID=UPI00342A1C8C
MTRPSPDPAARMAEILPDVPRRFALHRLDDPSGVSGTGIIAWGVAFGDGPDEQVVLRWRGTTTGVQQLCVFRSVAEVLTVHGHAGRTRIAWLDAEPGAAGALS